MTCTITLILSYHQQKYFIRNILRSHLPFTLSFHKSVSCKIPMHFFFLWHCQLVTYRIFFFCHLALCTSHKFNPISSSPVLKMVQFFLYYIPVFLCADEASQTCSLSRFYFAFSHIPFLLAKHIPKPGQISLSLSLEQLLPQETELNEMKIQYHSPG